MTTTDHPHVHTVVNPATEQRVADVPLTDLAGTDAAVAAAHEAFQSWRAVAPGERAALLRRFAAVVANFSNEPVTFMEKDQRPKLLFSDSAQSVGLVGPTRTTLKGSYVAPAKSAAAP